MSSLKSAFSRRSGASRTSPSSQRRRTASLLQVPHNGRDKKEDRFFCDPNTFNFSFESHRWCMTPQRFDVNERVDGDVDVKSNKNNSDLFVSFVGGENFFHQGNEKSKCAATP